MVTAGVLMKQLNYFRHLLFYLRLLHSFFSLANAASSGIINIAQQLMLPLYLRCTAIFKLHSITAHIPPNNKQDQNPIGCWAPSRKHNPRGPVVPVIGTRTLSTLVVVDHDERVVLEVVHLNFNATILQPCTRLLTTTTP